MGDRGGDVSSGSDGKAIGDADDRDTKGNVDVGDPPLPRCSFIEPLDDAVIEDTQTRVVLQTDNIAAGSVAAILVNFEPTKTAVVDKAGVAEFPTVPLPAPSSELVELRGDIRVSFNHHITCKIHVTVK